MDETKLTEMAGLVFNSGLNQLPTHTFTHTLGRFWVSN